MTTVWGKLSNREVLEFTLTNRSGVTVKAIEYGAAITAICVPDKKGRIENIALSCPSLEGYTHNTACLGAVAGRYANRIARGQFQLDGNSYQLTCNDGENHLHGGMGGFNKVIWHGRSVESGEGAAVEFIYISPDGEEGYPGTLTVKVTYTLTFRNELRIDYEATTDSPTIVNLTQHTYFNLSGDFTSAITGHRLRIMSDTITPVNRQLIPTGEMHDVAGTPFDFRTMREIGLRIDEATEQLAFGGGYDHNWVLRGTGQRKAAEVYEPGSGRMMTLFTDQPGLQFYSGNMLDGTIKGEEGLGYKRRTGFCLEAQNFPDAPNQPQFPPAVLRPREVYRQSTVYKFSTR